MIEAIIENVEEKKKMYASLDPIVKKDAIFASQYFVDFSDRVADCGEASGAIYRVALLQSRSADEVGRSGEDHRHGSATCMTPPTISAKSSGKVPVRTSDKTGFIVNRLLVPYMLDAIRAYEEGVGSIEDIDNAMKLGCGYPMGPFTLLDFVGLDTTYYITHVMYDEFKERRFASPPLLKRLVMAGWYGRKSGRGFYDYADPASPVAGKF